MLVNGGTCCSHCSKACSVRVEAVESLRRELLRHSMRSHKCLCVTATFDKSARHSSGTWRAERSFAPAGIASAVRGGEVTNRNESSRKLRILCQEDGATLKLVDAGAQRSL